MEEVNKNIELNITDKKLHISDVSSKSIYSYLSTHIISFKNFTDLISDEASETLETINKLLDYGFTKKEILDGFNNGFDTNKVKVKFKSFNELEKWLRTVGI